MLLAGLSLWVASGMLSAPASRSVGELPADLRPGRSVEFASASGATVRGWLLPGERGRGALALMHGVRADRLSMSGRARFLRRAGYTVLLFDFQAHGETMGKHITFGHLESRDAQAAINFLRASAPGERVGVVGVSMGGAALLLAEPPVEVDAIVLEMVYPTITEAVSNRLTMRLGRWATALTPLLTSQFRLRLGVSAAQLRPINRVGVLSAPKLFIAGADDRHTTLAESQTLFQAAREPKEFWAVEGARHEDLHARARAEYERRVLQFFAEHLRR
ncbi:MAG: alpha/beta hydrolase [Pyrinomonadaceae bacterium]